MVAGLRWRLFDFGRVDAEVKLAKGVNAEAILRFRASILRATEEVEDSFSLLAQSEVRGEEILSLRLPPELRIQSETCRVG